MFKSKLQEYCHSKAWVLPVYGAVTREGPDHCPRFKAVVDVNGISFTSPANCNTCKEAQNLAAKLAFEYLTGCLNTDIPVTCSPVSSNAQLPEMQQSEQTAPAFCDGANREVKDNNMFKDGKHMYKNQLQNYAQKRNLELPIYSVERVGPCHASRFKCKVTLEDKTYESEDYFYTLKEAESAAAKRALASIFPSGFEEDDPSIYKNILQQLLQKELKEISCFPKYTTSLLGPPHNPIFISMVEVQGETFRGQEAKTKKKAEMNAAKVAYITLRERKCKQDESVNALAVHMKETQLSSASVPERGSIAQPMFDIQVKSNHGKCKQDDSANAPAVRMKETLRLSSAGVPEGGSAAKPMFGKQVKSNQDNVVAATPSNSFTGMPEARISFNGTQEPKATQSAPETISCSNSPSPGSSSKSVDGLHGLDKEKKKKKKKKIMVFAQNSTGSHPDASVVHRDEKWIAFATDSS